VGGEYGATTGRPRRCGWFDGVTSRHSVQINGIDEVAITKLDVLSGLDEIKFAVAYQHNGTTTDRMPTDTKVLAQCRPVYKTFKGWKETCRSWSARGPAKAAKIYLISSNATLRSK
jgi:adenylosuccinate synthase